MRVGDLMRREFAKVGLDATLAELVSKFYPLHGDWAPVCQGSRLVGMIRYDDVARRVKGNGNLPATRARDLLSEEICYCYEGTRLSEAAALMSENHVGSLPVLSPSGDLIGMLDREQIPEEALLKD